MSTSAWTDVHILTEKQPHPLGQMSTPAWTVAVICWIRFLFSVPDLCGFHLDLMNEKHHLSKQTQFWMDAIIQGVTFVC